MSEVDLDGACDEPPAGSPPPEEPEPEARQTGGPSNGDGPESSTAEVAESGGDLDDTDGGSDGDDEPLSYPGEDEAQEEDPGTEAASPGAPSGPFGALLRLQDVDTRIAQLQHRRATMPERAELEEVRQHHQTLSSRAEILGTERQLLSDQLEALEREVEALSRRQAGIERRLLESRGAAARDLQAMDHEVHQLAQRRSDLEDQELSLMEDQEPVDAELAHLASGQSRLEEAAAALSAVLAVAEAALAAELTTLGVTRNLQASEIPPELAERYEALRSRLGGVGAARLVGNRCDGCHLELPSVEVERIRNLPPDEIATCEQCGRILVRTSNARPPA